MVVLGIISATAQGALMPAMMLFIRGIFDSFGGVMAGASSG
jgi:hypothetical protein